MGEATKLLGALTDGEAKSAEELLPLVYGELRNPAAHKRAHESSDQLLREQIARTVSSPAEVEDEIRDLFAALR